ncbi:uncharacterized protein PHACADRAFT_161565 [Phanerochaete carnosa HHB-10118-sp]|uniref:RNA-dependent RNA polymerase n=1 Tax=Phanerochaete carnosa (strain HHB-10118-sp) TaxID=650164 RepID=K5W8M9_PHACS|nr:uncharacterized protein PHACADRAFT_161565 [Phanerochaete carnosa HHB-10118-sp]EKM55555.1 hypothetical protein PHACADRAFT_161565 [Phanerochaete carnosa HHB-10118-sp]
MEDYVANIDPLANPSALKRALASVLHGPDFTGYHTLPLNFELSLHPARRAEYGGRRPRRRIRVGTPLTFDWGRHEPRPEVIRKILKFPYVDPVHEEEQFELARELRKHLVHIEAVQFGWGCRDDVFSAEYERDCEGNGRLGFDGDNRHFRLKIHEEDRNIILVSLGYYSESHRPVISLSLNYAPTYEEEELTGVIFDDTLDMFDFSKAKTSSGPSRRRLSTLDDDHEIYAEFTYLSVRLICQNEASARDFRWICERAHVPVHVGALPMVRRELFSQATVDIYDSWLSTLPWEVAFQVDALARANILDLQEIMRLRTPLLYFECYHAKVTPSRLLLEGPFPERCNRVVRKYAGHTSNFLRVSFMDENRLQYRFDRDVDGYDFIRKRFGTLLFEGLWIAGRHFKFLAYSQSALKNHSVWFVRDFTAHENGTEVHVTVDSIIAGLGIFRNVPQDLELMRCPARYGARVAQAFTTTEAAVEVEVEEVFPVEDMMDPNGYRSFTDGIGLVSQELAADIWGALQEKSVRHRRYGRCMPRAFQIRFQGFKGMLSVDHNLSGRAVCLRLSMKKFEAPESMTIEVASAFNKPGRLYLSRPLTMLLEGLKVRGGFGIFKTLQDAVIKDTKEATRSFRQAATLWEAYGLGTAFKLSSIFLDLAKFGSEAIEDPFLLQCLKFGIYHILRDLKYHARIPVPKGYSLVGVADIHGYLKEGEIFACVAQSWSSTIHPGDVQVATAIGRPPPGTVFDEEPLTNTVVFSTRGTRPLASCLSGGDLDGDVFMLTTLEGLLPTEIYEPAEYASAQRKTVPHTSTRRDVADFILEYFYSDNIGMIVSSWLVQADQSDQGIFDEACLTLAELHSDAADYPKTGNPVSMRKVPRYALPTMKPDWSAPEIQDRLGLFYQSQRSIGRLYREVQLPVPRAQPPPANAFDVHLNTADTIAIFRVSFKPRDVLERVMYNRTSQFISMPDVLNHSDIAITEICSILQDYARTLRQICVSFNISHRRAARLSEEEVVAGTIVAQSSQPRVRKEAVSQMREQSSFLVSRIAARIVGPKEGDGGKNEALTRAWLAYRLSTLQPHAFGFRSFGLVAMHEVFDAIKWIVAMGEREKFCAAV